MLLVWTCMSWLSIWKAAGNWASTLLIWKFVLLVHAGTHGCHLILATWMLIAPLDCLLPWRTWSPADPPARKCRTTSWAARAWSSLWGDRTGMARIMTSHWVMRQEKPSNANFRSKIVHRYWSSLLVEFAPAPSPSLRFREEIDGNFRYIASPEKGGAPSMAGKGYIYTGLISVSLNLRFLSSWFLYMFCRPMHMHSTLSVP